MGRGCAGWAGKGSRQVQCGYGSGLIVKVVVWLVNSASFADRN